MFCFSIIVAAVDNIRDESEEVIITIMRTQYIVLENCLLIIIIYINKDCKIEDSDDVMTSIFVSVMSLISHTQQNKLYLLEDYEVQLQLPDTHTKSDSTLSDIVFI